MKSIIDKAKDTFLQMIDNFGTDPYGLQDHVAEAEKWARLMLKKYPQADAEVVLLAVWLHDIGHYPIPTEIDHAIRGEQRAKEFLELENYDKEKTLAVLHCVRSHRCRDVMPEPLEAKMVAFVDSASHMTDTMYMKIARDDKANNQSFRVYAKMDRDFRDLSSFPEMQKELTDLYHSWQKLLKEYEKVDL
jgi:HD superfamily phosphodiesterase